MTDNSKEEAKDVTEENKCSNVAQDTGELQDKELDAVTGGLVTLSSIAILIG